MEPLQLRQQRLEMEVSTNLKKELATYILKLHEAAQKTKRAEDRPVYEAYLSSAAIILALAESGAEEGLIRNEIEAHERLWGNRWLDDDVYKSPSEAWQKVLKCIL